MKYDLKQIQKKLENTFAIKFHDDFFGSEDNKCITNITNKCELSIYIGRYNESVTWHPQKEHIAFMWGQLYGNYSGIGTGFYTVDEVIAKMDSLGYPRRTSTDPKQLSLF